MKKYLMLYSLSLLFTHYAQAGTPLWTFTPLTPTTVTVSQFSPTNVKYLLTNQSGEPHRFFAQAFIFTITDLEPLSCGTFFGLEPGQSCILNVFVNWRALLPSFRGGPVVCQDNSQFACYTPSEKDILTVIFAGNSLLINQKVLDYAKNDTEQVIKVTNSSTDEIAENIHVDLSKNKLSEYFQQDASDCIKVLPQQSCSIYLRRLTAQGFTNIPLEIQGDNTQKSIIKVNGEEY